MTNKIYSKQEKHKQQSGFTMIELLVVIVLLGVLASLATPRLQSLLNHYQLRTKAEAIESLFEEAQNIASTNAWPSGCTGRLISTNIELDNTDHHPILTFTCTSGTATLKSLAILSPFTFNIANSCGFDVHFTAPVGTASFDNVDPSACAGGGAKFTLAHSNLPNKYQITIERGGRIYVEPI